MPSTLGQLSTLHPILLVVSGFIVDTSVIYGGLLSSALSHRFSLWSPRRTFIAGAGTRSGSSSVHHLAVPGHLVRSFPIDKHILKLHHDSWVDSRGLEVCVCQWHCWLLWNDMSPQSVVPMSWLPIGEWQVINEIPVSCSMFLVNVWSWHCLWFSIIYK